TWFDQSDLHYTHLFYILWLAEGYLRRGDRVAARPLIDRVLETSRRAGYPQLEGRACWLMSECLAFEAPASSEEHAEIAICLFKRMDAQSDLARAMVSRAALRQRAGDVSTSRRLLNRARAIFEELDTRDEPGRVEEAFAALERGLPI